MIASDAGAASGAEVAAGRDAPSALITGASRGIGHGIARHLASQGWSLTVNARDLDRLRNVADELTRLGATVTTVDGDMAEEATLDAAVAAHAQAYGSMNALVVAAGVGTAGPIDGYPARRLDKQFAVNFRAPFGLVARSLPLLRAGAAADPDRGGRIIALSSIEGTYPEPGLAAYGASKAALISLMKSVNAEEALNGISASAISPGYVNTEMSAWIGDKIPPETMIAVSDIVKVVDLILSVSPNVLVPHIELNRRGGGAYHA